MHKIVSAKQETRNYHETLYWSFFPQKKKESEKSIFSNLRMMNADEMHDENSKRIRED